MVGLLLGPPKVSLLQAEPVLFPQPLPTGQVLQPQLSWWPFAKLTLVYQCSLWTGRAKTGCRILMWSMGAGQCGMIASLGRLVGLLFIQPRVLVGLSAARACCWLLSGLLADTSSRSSSAGTPVLFPGVFLPGHRTPHLSMLHWMRFPLARSSSPSRSL